ncbi:MAG: hypothetical protein IKU37_08785 [Candidatus Gastranaerophilales bacterium]|nr:hypothetical protein [Candidatus Gastranaerophilales bacterium]
MEIEKKYFLREFTIKVNQRELFYDFNSDRIIYTYKGINKLEFNLSVKKWQEMINKYQFWCEYSITRYEERNNDYSRN